MMRWILSLTCFIAAFIPFSAFADYQQLTPITPQIAAELYNAHGSSSVAGNPKGGVTLVEFFDYNCNYCRGMQPVVAQLIAKNPNLRVVYKEFLLFGKDSMPAVKAALAAQQQGKYLVMHNALLKATHPLTQAETLRIAKANGLDAKKLQTDMASAAIEQQMNANTKLVKLWVLKVRRRLLLPAVVLRKTLSKLIPNNIFMSEAMGGGHVARVD